MKLTVHSDVDEFGDAALELKGDLSDELLMLIVNAQAGFGSQENQQEHKARIEMLISNGRD